MGTSDEHINQWEARILSPDELDKEHAEDEVPVQLDSDQPGGVQSLAIEAAAEEADEEEEEDLFPDQPELDCRGQGLTDDDLEPLIKALGEAEQILMLDLA